MTTDAFCFQTSDGHALTKKINSKNSDESDPDSCNPIN